MNLSDIKYIEVDGDKLPFKLCMKANIFFEKLAGKSFYLLDPASLEDILMMIFSGFLAGHSYAEKEMKMNFSDFLLLIDEHPEILGQCQEIQDAEKVTVELENAPKDTDDTEDKKKQT